MCISVELVATSLPDIYVEQILEYVSKQINNSHHIEFYLNWSTKLLTAHAPKDNLFKQQSLVSIQDSLTRKHEQLSKVCDFSKYTLKVLIEMCDAKAQAQADAEINNDDENTDSDSQDLEDNLMLLKASHRNNIGDSDASMKSESEVNESASDDESM